GAVLAGQARPGTALRRQAAEGLAESVVDLARPGLALDAGEQPDEDVERLDLGREDSIPHKRTVPGPPGVSYSATSSGSGRGVGSRGRCSCSARRSACI